MCGISVVVALRGTSLHNTQIKEQLDSSLDRIQHRGPDSRGQWISGDGRSYGSALGHCRLAINDLSDEGIQPLHDEDNQIHAVVNGEIYDHETLRTQLTRDHGYRFIGHSDSEVVVALYKHYGIAFLSHLRGEFSLCLFDSRKQLFIAAKDRYGIKPLFWTIVDDKLLIAAEAKAFLALGWRPEWDVRSIVDGGYNHDTRTLFKNVYKIRPGGYMTLTSFECLRQFQYWDPEFQDKTEVETRTEAEMIEGVQKLMLDSIRLRLRADVPVGVYLSGGIDSSVIAGMIKHLVETQGIKLGSKDPSEQICCFTIAFDEDSGHDESDIAGRTAEWLGVKFIKKHMDEEALVARFADSVYHCETLNPDLNSVGKFALSEEPREQGYKVVLTGEGSDEHFAGYPLFLPDYLQELDQSWPASLVASDNLNTRHAAAIQFARDDYAAIGGDVSRMEPSLASRQVNDITAIGSMSAFDVLTFAPWTQTSLGAIDRRDTIVDDVDERTRKLMREKWHPLHSALYVWSKGLLANNLLTCLGDRTEMAHSVEARTPFLDHHLTEYVNRLPPSMKIRYDPVTKQYTEKWILREASKPFITRELYERRKFPYSAPTRWPMEGRLHRLFKGLITEEKVENLGFIDWEKAREFLDQAFVDGDRVALRQTIYVATFVVLAERFGISRAEPPKLERRV